MMIVVSLVLFALLFAFWPLLYRRRRRREVRARILWSHNAWEKPHMAEEVNIHIGHTRLAHFTAESADHDVVPPGGPVTWSCDDPEKVSLDPTPDGIVCTVKALALTTAPVLIHATDGITQATSAPINCISEVETHAEITFDDEVRP